MERKTLKEARIKAGYNLNQLAAIVGVSANTIYSWETGRRNPPFKKAVKLVGILGEQGLTLADLGYYV